MFGSFLNTVELCIITLAHAWGKVIRRCLPHGVTRLFLALRYVCIYVCMHARTHTYTDGHTAHEIMIDHTNTATVKLHEYSWPLTDQEHWIGSDTVPYPPTASAHDPELAPLRAVVAAHEVAVMVNLDVITWNCTSPLGSCSRPGHAAMEHANAPTTHTHTHIQTKKSTQWTRLNGLLIGF